jgi:hypothetical protein
MPNAEVAYARRDHLDPGPVIRAASPVGRIERVSARAVCFRSTAQIGIV